MESNMQNQTMELDLIGQYYASIINHKQSGVFALCVHLTERLNPQVLQQAANDLMCRLPFLNGRLRRGFFHYKFEILKAPPEIRPAGNGPLFCDYYNSGSRHMINIIYGERDFTVRTTHSICDGRGLSKITAALLVRYFELLGVTMADRGDIIDCAMPFQAEEAENAYERFVEKRPAKLAKKREAAGEAGVYHPKYAKSASQQVLTKLFDGGKLKVQSKAHGVTITEYILAKIFEGVRQEREAAGEKKPISAMIPVDCRSFFPSKTLRSFVSSANITMPETKDFSDMLQEIAVQFREISQECMQADINELQNMYHSARYVPRVLKAWFMRLIARSESAGQTTGFSNLGRIQLPREIESRVARFEFSISLEHDTPYFFSCVTVGNALAFTASFREEGRKVVEAVMEGLEDLCQKHRHVERI